MSGRRGAVLAGLLALGAGACATGPAPRGTGLTAGAIEDLERFARAEMRDKGLPALSIAVLDGGRIVWARGFGEAGSKSSTPARADTVYRAGSISKLVTDLCVLRLVDRGDLALDVPVRRWLPGFRVQGEGGERITLRHLMTHRSGLVREPPVGGYFDPHPRSLAETVASLERTSLVFRPGARFKYSNAGLAVVGRVVEVVTGKPFARAARELVLGPLGLRDTAFAPGPALRRRLACGWMWAYDGRWRPAPARELGMAPAANLYATVEDLARLARAWMPTERGGVGLLAPHTRDELLRGQLRSPRGSWQIGLGPFLERFSGRLRAGHNGAMYGFATELASLPEEGLAVAVVANVDFANAVPRRLADRALRWMLASRGLAEAPAPAPASAPVGRERAAALAGVWSSGERRLRLRARGEELELEPPLGVRMRVRAVGGRWVVDDRVTYGLPVEPLDGGRLRFGGAVWERLEDTAPPAAPEWMAERIGQYGEDENVLYVLERDGRLTVLVEWFAFYPLRRVEADRFVLPDAGWYAGESLTFDRDRTGRIAAVRLGGVRFARRPLPDLGATFRIRRMLSPAELRARARAARPPVQPAGLRAPDLVDLAELDPTIQLDVRYATTNNFMGMAFYPRARAMLQRPAAAALVRAHRRLAARGFGLRVFDAYRPWYVTKMFFDATPPELRVFVADPARGSRHNRGCAVDLTLYDRATGEAVEMPSGYDEFTPRAHADHPGGTTRQRWHRNVLRRAMEAEGFAVYEHEWWHFDHRDWRRYPVLNVDLR